MPVLLQIRNAHKHYGDQILLDGAEASITDEGKVGFVVEMARVNQPYYESCSGKKSLMKVRLSVIPGSGLAICVSMILFYQVKPRSIF